MRRALMVCLLAGLAWGGALPLAAQSQQGKLQIFQDGKLIGSEQYEINTTATEIEAQGETELKVGDQQVSQSCTLLLNADLSPRRYEWKLKEPRESRLRVEFQGPQAHITFLRSDGKEEEQIYNFENGRVAVLDVNVFHHFLLLTRLYDFERGGTQSIPVFIPQAVQPGVVTVELQGVDRMTLDGKEEPVRRLSIATEDNSLLLWVSESGRFVRLEVPQAKVEVLPEGAQP
jgi:hypothetical protein